MFAATRLARLGEFTPEFPDAWALHQGLATMQPACSNMKRMMREQRSTPCK